MKLQACLRDFDRFRKGRNEIHLADKKAFFLKNDGQRNAENSGPEDKWIERRKRRD